jgi:hypothetical protein
MLLFGHVGITLAVAALANRAIDSCSLPATRNRPRWSHEISSDGCLVEDHRSIPGASWVVALGRRIDIRVLLIGSLLPDIVDKPLGQVFFKETFSNGRIFCHSLLFLLLVGLLGLYLYRIHQRVSFLVLSFSVLTPLILDQMWRQPRTLLWPLFGFAFEKVELRGWLQGILHSMYADPGAYVPDAIGLMALSWFALALVRRRTVRVFITHGRC